MPGPDLDCCAVCPDLRYPANLPQTNRSEGSVYTAPDAWLPAGPSVPDLPFDGDLHAKRVLSLANATLGGTHYACVDSRVIDVDSGVSGATAVSRRAILIRWGSDASQTSFDDTPLTEDFLEWMASPDGQAAGEVSGLVFAALENASVDATRRKIIWADGKRLSIEQSAERIHEEHPDRPPAKN